MNRSTISIFSAAAIVIAALTANAAQADEKAAAQATGKSSAADTCVFSRTINDWEVIDSTHLAVWAPTRHNAYVVELSFPLPRLKFEHSLGFQDRNNDGQFCSYGGDSIIVGGPMPDRVWVRSVRRSDAEEIKTLIAEAKAAREKPKATLGEQSGLKSDKPSQEKTSEPPPKS